MVVEWIHDSVSGTLNTSSEAVILTLIVVIAHIASGFFLYFDFSNCVFLDHDIVTLWSTTFVFDVVIWLSSATVLPLGDVDLSLWKSLISDNVGLTIVVVSALLSRCGNVDVDLRCLSVIGTLVSK